MWQGHRAGRRGAGDLDHRVAQGDLLGAGTGTRRGGRARPAPLRRRGGGCRRTRLRPGRGCWGPRPGRGHRPGRLRPRCRAGGRVRPERGCAGPLTQGGAEYWMDLAVSLTRRLPATLAALAEGTIDLNRAKLIDQYTSSLDAGLARAVERRVLVRAEHQTTGQLRASLQRAVLAADPAAAERRRQEAQRR